MFRLRVNDQKLKQAQEAGTQTEEDQAAWGTKLQKALGEYEQAVQEDIESSGDRPAIHEALNHLLIAGNVLLADSRETGKPLRVFTLPRYVVSRDPMGTWRELVIKEQTSLNTLPPEQRTAVEEALQTANSEPDTGIRGDDDHASVDIYTHVLRENARYAAYQECAGVVIAGTQATYPLDGCPYIPLRMLSVAGEDYGRAYVENFLGDLKSLEALTQAIVEGAAVSSKVVFLVNPNGTTKAVDLQRLPNGGIGEGNANDVTTVQVQKAADFRVALETAQMLTTRLAKAFMLLDGIRRDAERVTAEEIRAMAAELEATLGGIYSILAQEFQYPYVQRRIHRLTKAGKLDKLPGDLVHVSIITGFEALGRGNDKQKLVDFISNITQTLGPDAALRYCNPSELISRLATSDGIDTAGLIKTPEQLQAEQEQAKQMQAMEALGPEAVKAFSGAMAQGQTSPSPQQPIEGVQ